MTVAELLHQSREQHRLSKEVLRREQRGEALRPDEVSSRELMMAAFHDRAQAATLDPTYTDPAWNSPEERGFTPGHMLTHDALMDFYATQFPAEGRA